MPKKPKVLTTDNILNELKSTIEKDGYLTHVEFLICTEELKSKYISIILNDDYSSRNIQDWLYNYLTEEQKRKIINSCIKDGERLGEYILNTLSKKDKDKYIEARLKQEPIHDLYDYELDILPKEAIIKFYTKSIDSNSYTYIENEKHFNLLPDEYKVKYILYHGLKNVDDFISK